MPADQEHPAPESDPVPQPRAASDPARRAAPARITRTGRARHRLAGMRHNPLLSGALIALLCVALGVAMVAQIRRTQAGETLAGQRPQDLVVLLDGLQQREAALRKEVADSEAALRRLQASGDSSAAALEEAKRRASALAVLAGTVPVVGPGLRLEVGDPQRQVTQEVLLDVLQELRGAGAEAMQVGPVRVGVDSAFTVAGSRITLDGTELSPPYVIVAIGDPPTLAAALNIPGGVIDTVERKGGTARIQQQERMEITALRPDRQRKYARPAG